MDHAGKFYLMFSSSLKTWMKQGKMKKGQTMRECGFTERQTDRISMACLSLGQYSHDGFMENSTLVNGLWRSGRAQLSDMMGPLMWDLVDDEAMMGMERRKKRHTLLWLSVSIITDFDICRTYTRATACCKALAEQANPDSRVIPSRWY